MRGGSRRVVLGLAILALGALDVAGLLLSLRAHNRLRDRTLLQTREHVLEGWPRILASLRSSPAGEFDRVVRHAVSTGLASEAEVFSLEGKRLLSFPVEAPASHWPTPTEIEQAASGNVLTFGPLPPSLRVLSYVPVTAVPGARPVLVRLATDVPELIEDLRERRLQIMGHGATLLLLVLAGAMIAVPTQGERDSAVSPSALLAYEEAMGRLRDRGQDLEEQMQDKEALARAGELTAGMAHELRNGLGTILGYARLLERGELPAEATDAGRSVREECETLEGIIRRFMDYVKHETLNPATFDLRRMLSRVASRETRGGAGADVELAGGDLGTLFGDEGLLERAFENLVRNAREAAGGSGHVRIDVSRRDAQVIVAVRDDGPGMPDEVKNGLRPFFTTKSGGLGLGLALTLKLVRMHGGSLVLSDRAPRGLQVSVVLPAGPAENDSNRYPS
jgi:signal transduction histidine kinase